jgi:hypothetical protein
MAIVNQYNIEMDPPVSREIRKDKKLPGRCSEYAAPTGVHTPDLDTSYKPFRTKQVGMTGTVEGELSRLDPRLYEEELNKAFEIVVGGSYQHTTASAGARARYVEMSFYFVKNYLTAKGFYEPKEDLIISSLCKNWGLVYNPEDIKTGLADPAKVSLLSDVLIAKHLEYITPLFSQSTDEDLQDHCSELLRCLVNCLTPETRCKLATPAIQLSKQVFAYMLCDSHAVDVDRRVYARVGTHMCEFPVIRITNFRNGWESRGVQPPREGGI